MIASLENVLTNFFLIILFFFFVASKNHRDEKHDMHYQAMAKDITKDVSSLNMQKRIDDANLQIASVSRAYLCRPI